MSDVKWTRAQRNAIEARDGSVLVSAAAGSGKTAVLVERIIEAVCDKDNPVSLDRMLIVTFTRAASAEMRARIEKALTDKLSSDPFNKHLQNQRRLLYSAMISTIDSFCVDFVRRYFFELDIQSDFRIADDGELDILTNKALDTTLEFFYKQSDKAFLDLVSSVCNFKNDENLRKHIKKAYYFLTSIPFPEKWYDMTLNYYDAEKTAFEDTPYYSFISDYIKDSLGYCADINMTALRYVEENENIPEEVAARYKALLADDSQTLINVYNQLESSDWDEIRDLIMSVGFKSMPRVKKGVCDDEKAYITASRDKYKKELKKLSGLLKYSSSEIKAKTQRAYPVMKAFTECVRMFSDELYKLKLEKNILGFADISRLMVELLYDYNGGDPTLTPAAVEIASQFDAVMVDEFQDINEVQDIIFRAVTADRNNLFVVGDVKQSIYQFRQAKPQIFIGYKNKYPLFDSEKADYPSKIILDRNFRSAGGVTEAINFIFETLMMRDTGGIEYNNEEKLVCGASYPESDSPSMELMLISSEDLNPEKNETELSLEAVRVAEKIYSLVYEEKMQIPDGDSTRDIEYGDIAILTRSPKGMARRAVTFVETLNRYGIPTISDEKNSFFDANEIKVILNILRVIDNPLQDIPVLSAAMSSVFGFTADDMAEIRSEYRAVPIYSAIKKSADKNPLCRGFIDFIEKTRRLAVTTTVDRLINIIIESTGFEAITTAVNREPAKNLRLLRDYARSFASNGYKTLSSFINYIDRLKENETELNSGTDAVDETMSAVHIKSIHKSKGLEYPVCFICCTSTEFNLDDTKQDFIVDADFGAGMRYKENFVKYDSIQRKALSMRLRDNSVFEEIRVLYVALTRAKQRIIVTCVKENPEDYLMNLESKIPAYPISPYVIKNVRSFSDWLFMCALKNPACDIPRVNIKPDIFGCDKDAREWKFSIIRGEYARLSNKKVKARSTAPRGKSDESYLAKLKSKIDFEYKNKPLEALPQKVSASQLSHLDNGIFSKILRKPDFMREEKSDGAERGTAFHAFMERCDLSLAVDNSRAEAERLSEKGFITERQKELLDYDKIDSFLRSDLIRRAVNSERLYREYTFTVEINASDYDSNIQPEFAGNKLVMQGAVDLIFIENNRAVIVDYKTDRVGEAIKLRDMYRRQLELYRNAVTEIMGIDVSETLIYSIYKNEVVDV